MKFTWKNMKIRGRLLAGFSIVVGMTLLVGVLAIFQMSELADLTEKLYRHPYTVSTSVRDIKAGIIAMDRSMKDVALAQDDEALIDAMNMVSSYQGDIYAQFDLLSERFLGDPEIITNARLLFEDWQPIREEVIELIRQGDRQAAATIAVTTGRKQISEIETAIADILQFANSKGEEFNASANATRQRAMSILIIMLAAVILSGGLIAILITRSISRPIHDIIVVLREIEQGDGDLTRRLNMVRMDEIGEMSRLFDSFLLNISGMLKKILASSDQVQDATSQISAASEQLAAGSEEQQAQLSEVATTMEEMSAMILEASKNADETKNQVQLNGSKVKEGRDLVAKTVTGFEEVARTVSVASKQIDELSKRSEEIGNVIQVIEDIADQTNLLALNANIEAARAGDAGRGFAVVADEVRKLAERTVSATAEISNMIESIQSDIRNAVKSMETTKNQSNAGLELVAESDRSLEKIAGGIGDVVSGVELIAAASNEQSTGAEEISRNIEGVSTVAKETANSAQMLATSAEQLNREVDGLNQLIAQFKLEE